MKLITNGIIAFLRPGLVLLAALAVFSCKEKGPREYKADDTTVVDIGTIKEADGPYEFIVIYKNNTPDTIVAAQSRTSCGCTTPMVNNLPVPPGHYQRIPIKYNPAYRKGAIDEQVDIRYKDGTIRSFPFIGNVIPMKHPVTDHARYHLGRNFYTSYKLLSFGLLNPGETKDMYFSLGNDTRRNMKVEFKLEGDESGLIRMSRELTMMPDGRDTLHVSLTMPDGSAPGDSVVVRVQPVVNGVPTEESMTIRAKTR